MYPEHLNYPKRSYWKGRVMVNLQIVDLGRQMFFLLFETVKKKPDPRFPIRSFRGQRSLSASEGLIIEIFIFLDHLNSSIPAMSLRRS